jgi:oxygen-independent coproporphyrinogen-3 oxidase
MLEAIEARLAAAGILQYELTNYARPGRESVHNIRYWLRQPVLGLGVGAWSSEGPRPGAPHGARRANLRELAAYLSRIEAGESAAAAVERLDAATARGEAVFLALRRRQGLAASGFRREFGAPPRDFFERSIEQLGAEGLLIENRQGDLRLSARGRLLADLVCQHFV